MKLSGFIAWLLWRAIYLMKLPGLDRKLRVSTDWFLDLVFPLTLSNSSLKRARVYVENNSSRRRSSSVKEIVGIVFMSS